MLTIKELNRKVAGIRKSASTIRANIHTVLVNLAGHAYEHGDVSIAVNLLDATKGVDKVAVVRYLRDHCFTTVKADGTVKLNKAARKDADFVDGEAVVAYLTENVSPWYEDAISTETAASILDPVKTLESLVKRIGKQDCDEVKIDMAAVREAFGHIEEALKSKDSERHLRQREVSEVAEGRQAEDRQAA